MERTIWLRVDIDISGDADLGRFRWWYEISAPSLPAAVAAERIIATGQKYRGGRGYYVPASTMKVLFPGHPGEHQHTELGRALVLAGCEVIFANYSYQHREYSRSHHHVFPAPPPGLPAAPYPGPEGIRWVGPIPASSVPSEGDREWLGEDAPEEVSAAWFLRPVPVGGWGTADTAIEWETAGSRRPMRRFKGAWYVGLPARRSRLAEQIAARAWEEFRSGGADPGRLTGLRPEERGNPSYGIPSGTFRPWTPADYEAAGLCPHGLGAAIATCCGAPGPERDGDVVVIRRGGVVSAAL